MNAKSFFLSWILSSVAMFSLSYLLHGIFLNDLQRIPYPKEIFLIGASITYLILGFLVTKIYLLKFPEIIATRPFLRGLFSGAFLGAATYIMALVVGVSFSSELTIQYIIFDLLWQMAEQSFGGIAVAFVYLYIYEGNPLDVIAKKLFGD